MNPESSHKREGENENNQIKKKPFGKNKIQCYNCENFGHYANECWYGKGKKSRISEEETNTTYESSHYVFEPLILMVTTTEDTKDFMIWYLDIRCSNHMTSNKKVLAEFDHRKRAKVNLPCNN